MLRSWRVKLKLLLATVTLAILLSWLYLFVGSLECEWAFFGSRASLQQRVGRGVAALRLCKPLQVYLSSSFPGHHWESREHSCNVGWALMGCASISQLGLCPTVHTWFLLAELCLTVPIACPVSSPQMAAPSCCHPAWVSSRAGSWSGRHWPCEYTGWRKRTGSSISSSARHRQRVMMGVHSGGPLLRMGTQSGVRGATTQPAPSSGQCTSVRWVMALAEWYSG